MRAIGAAWYMYSRTSVQSHEMATRLLVAALQAAAAATAAAPADDARNTSCSVPPPSSAAVPPLSQLLNASLACSLGTAASPTDALSVQLSQQAVPETAYLDMRTTVFDRPASRLAAGKRVRVGLVTSIYGWNRLDNDTGATVAALEALATSDGPPLDLVTLEEEHNCNHGFTKERCCPHDNCALAAPFLSALKAVAKKHSFWLVVPMRTLDASSGRMSNSAVVVNRSGELAHSVAGQLSYDKTYPVLGKPAAGPGETGGESAVVPGSTGVQVWDTDFGRIAVLICFDINYFELWQEAYALGAEIVLWPTAMATPDRDMISLARAFRYSVVGCGHPGDIVDSTGRSVNQTVVRTETSLCLLLFNVPKRFHQDKLRTPPCPGETET